MKKIIFALFVLATPALVSAQGNAIPDKKKGTAVFAAGANSASSEADSQYSDNLTLKQKEKFSQLQLQARDYRRQGLDYQNKGDLDTAMSFYQKAIMLDPAYVVAYNDLGVIYETNGFPDRAEESYLKAIQVDPNYLSAYSNLALYYENKRDLEKAALYWDRRVKLGVPNDPWTEKARQRLNDIRLVLSSTTGAYASDEDVISLLKNTLKDKESLRENNANLAKDTFDKAQRAYAKGDDITAFKLALDALQMDPTNAEIGAFIEKIQTRSLSK